MIKYNQTDRIYIRPLIRWHGGKTKWGNALIQAMNIEHNKYMEVCIGGGSVFLNKPRTRKEVISDINADLINLYRMVKYKSQELIHLVKITESIPETFYTCLSLWEDVHESVHRALGFLIINRMSYRNFGRNFEPNNRWSSMPERIERVSKRLKGVAIEEICLLDQIRNQRSKTLIFIDPPYLNSHYHLYGHIFSVQKHLALLETIRKSKAKILITGMDSQIYHSRLSEWHCEQKKNTSRASPHFRTFNECLWRNY